MLKRLRAKHPVGFCVLSEVLFLGSLLLSSYLIVFALVLFGVDLERVDSYFLSAVQEAVGMVVALVILGRTGKMYLLRRRGSGFFNGLLVGMYPLVLIGYSLYTKLMFGMPEDGQLQPAFSIFSFFLSMALVGVAEEFIFRGVIAQSLLERFGTGRAGVWKACLLSGLLFGAAHLTNLLSSAPFGVLMQCVFAASLGTLFAAIYFRTGNLWVTVFLHGAMDIASMLVGGLYGTAKRRSARWRSTLAGTAPRQLLRPRRKTGNGSGKPSCLLKQKGLQSVKANRETNTSIRRRRYYGMYNASGW